jgi:hypothetical protein
MTAVSKILVFTGITLWLSLVSLPVPGEEGSGSTVQVQRSDGVRSKTWKTLDELSG